MMERRALLISLGISLLSMYLVYQYLATEEKRLQEEYGTFFPMVVTAKDVLQFQTIHPTDIEIIRVPKAMVPPGRISNVKDVVDAIAAVPMTKGEQVLDNKIISKNVYSGLNTQITIGKRAISVPVNVRSSISYHLRPGNRVDLAAHFEYKANKANISEVKVFMQDLLVLATGKNIQTLPPKGVDQQILRGILSKLTVDPDQVRETLNEAKTEPIFSTISLEVTPQQAQAIAYVLTVFPDTIICLLRHSDDRKLERTQTVNLYDVMGPDSYLVKGDKKPAPIAVPKPRFFDYIGGQPVPVQ